jgi:hypothetical protein
MEIRIMAGGGKCRIVDGNGLYLHFEKGKPVFKAGRIGSVVYDYVKDDVPAQIENVKESFGADWFAVPAEGE